LRNNDLAAVTIDGAVNVIPVGIIRQYPLPAIPNDDSLHDEEWVTGVLPLKNAPAPSIVPIMRPMMPQAAHLAAYPYSNSVIIVDRLGNARRILNLIRRLDQTTSSQTE
jgi:general secretion pathway protein D